MFRKPREPPAPVASEPPLRPSTGRPPTPPRSTGKEAQPAATATTYSPADSTSTPLIGRTKMLPKRTPASAWKSKVKANGNGNIMSFFKKAESGGTSGAAVKEEEESLFVDERPVKVKENVLIQIPTPPRDDILQDRIDFSRDNSPISRYNEDVLPSKRRKTDGTALTTSKPLVGESPEAPTKGPFADDSESDEVDTMILKRPLLADDENVVAKDEERSTPTRATEYRPVDANAEDFPPPRLKRETTSIGGANEFDGLGDFIDDEFPEDGEEHIERRWMEEQEELEMGLEDDDHEGTIGADRLPEEPRDPTTIVPNGDASASCPICGGSTAGMTEQASRIVGIRAIANHGPANLNSR